MNSLIKFLELFGMTNKLFLAKFMGDCSTWWASDQIMQPWWDIHFKVKLWPFYWIMEGFILEVNGWVVSKVMSCLVSLMLTLTWSIDILSKKLTPEIGGWILKTPFAHHVSGGGDFMQIRSSFLISLVVTCTFMPWF